MCVDNFRRCVQKCKWIIKGFYWGHREWFFLYSRLSVFISLVLYFSLLFSYFFIGQYIYTRKITTIFDAVYKGPRELKCFWWWGHRKKFLPYSRLNVFLSLVFSFWQSLYFFRGKYKGNTGRKHFNNSIAFCDYLICITIIVRSSLMHRQHVR
jgi:hypothetical protein